MSADHKPDFVTSEERAWVRLGLFGHPNDLKKLKVLAPRLLDALDAAEQRLSDLPASWERDGRDVMFNKAALDLTPWGRVHHWLKEQITRDEVSR